MAIIHVLIYINLVFLVYFLISNFSVKKKTKNILNSQKLYNSKSKAKFFNSYINKIESKLFNLEYPYKINAKKYSL